jgi:uncharacterized OB-fold protein
MTTETGSTLELARCETCLARFLPTEGPCPRCGSPKTVIFPVPEVGLVLAATELLVPPPGVPAPHGLAFVEVAEGVRLLASVDGPLPGLGVVVAVKREGDVYLARADPASEK